MSRLVSVLAACRTPEDQARAEAICAAQTYTNIELVAPELGRDYDAIYNDGSTGCAEIHVATYLAHGDYYAYLFPGDVFRPDHIALLVDLLEVSKANFVYSQLGYGGDEVVGSDPPRFGEISASTILSRAQLTLAENWRDGGAAFEWDMVTRWIGIGARWAHLPRITVDRPKAKVAAEAEVPALEELAV